MALRPTRRIALIAVAALALGIGACGDEESDDGSTAPAIEISIPTDGTTAETTTSDQTETDAAATTPSEAKKQQEDVAKIKGGSERIPGVGDVPKPSAEQQQRIAECVERAQGDPKKLAKCGRIAVN